VSTTSVNAGRAETSGPGMVVRRIGPESAEAVHAVVRSAFGARPRLDPPADADGETLETIAAALAPYGGLLAEEAGEPVGTLIFDRVGDRLFLRRFGVVPASQRSGVARTLVDTAVSLASAVGGRDVDAVAVVAREELPASVRFWRVNGFHQVALDPPYLRLERRVRVVVNVSDAEAMRALGRRLAPLLSAGDVVVLNGELGAGKTTFTQGLGAGLEVRGEVTSPTFVIARVHPPLGTGPGLVHVDAYRLGGIAELDDLDLDTSLDDAVTIVEWGGGIAEGLAQSRLEVSIERAAGALSDLGPRPVEGSDAEESLDPRRVILRPVGARWRLTDWNGLIGLG
jgi:tRNA threonylcarbamoyladenosine biosynthesis protein TsaE